MKLLFYIPFYIGREKRKRVPIRKEGAPRVDILWSQRIKLIKVVSTLEFHEYSWIDVVFIFFVSSVFCIAIETSDMDCFRNSVRKF